MKERFFYVYIIASAARVLYIGITGNLHKRVWEHKNGVFEGFTSKFKACRLVYWESFDRVENAIDREKQLKRWRREKVHLIEKQNRDWHDLSDGWFKD